MKKILLISMIFISTYTFSKDKKTTVKPKKIETASKVEKNIISLKTKHGVIEIKLYPSKAPKTVKRIKELIKKDFYNGLVFHRVIPGFVAQAGDPAGNGSGGTGVKINAEFNEMKHIPGTVAMARKGNDIHSADSQFYISLGKHPHLDGKYTIFGKVIKGLNFASKIKKGDKILDFSIK